MKRLFCIAALLAATAAVADPSAGRALTLTSLMRTDEFLANAATDGVRRAQPDGKVRDAAHVCAEQIDRARFTAVVAKLFAERLSVDELDQAIEFYRTEAGKKYTRRIFDRTAGKPAEQLTTGEQMRINQFSQSASGRKLLTSAVLEDAEEVRTTTVAAINDALLKCAGEPVAPK